MVKNNKNNLSNSLVFGLWPQTKMSQGSAAWVLLKQAGQKSLIVKSFSFRPIQTEVRKGETIILSCGASGFPDPTYEWFRDGGRLSSAHSRYKASQTSQQSFLLHLDYSQLNLG